MTTFTVEKSAGITTLGLFLMMSGLATWLGFGVPQQLASGSSFWVTAGIALAVTGFLLLLIGVHRALSSLDALAEHRFPTAHPAPSQSESVQ
ncbi:hypothetical protein [Arthrobacter sp. H20]|uniref:hypothetical protein n=1 Tax=Arthrobacter sp. H20 TaxID=1267981 RepID=UPI0004799655|nr:hypothetical protein [Arthrobacter sp. H20]